MALIKINNNMKNIFTAILFFNLAFGFSQVKVEPKPFKSIDSIKKYDYSPAGELSNDSDSDYTQIFTSVEINAQPKEGLNSFRKYFSTSFRTPEVDNNIKATIQVRFVVFEDGSLHDFQILKETPIGLGLGTEAIRVLKTSKNWIPGQLNGKIVKQYYTFPINIEIKGAVDDSLPIDELKKEVVSTTVQDSSKTNYNQIFITVDEIATPENGMNAFRQYIASSFNSPNVKSTLIAKVIAKFVVSEEGVLSNVEILKEEPLNLGLGKEAERVLLASPRWKPALYKGKAVKQYYTLPIMIQIEEEKTKK